MNDYQLGEVEGRFADIIWSSAPIPSPELCKLALKELNWKKSTTYTVLKRLCEKGLFVNDKGIVKTVISREEYFSIRSDQFIKDTFDGSLPAFLVAFTKRNKLTDEEIETLLKIVNKQERE